MKTKQEIIDFLESKVGTNVVCVGNTKLSGECVTLIKSLMEFLGVPDPYKSRGNAKDCIANYLKEGIAKPGTGFISVFSNKNMGGGFGHVWCNAGEGKGEFYESNGAKPLTVTKGKTYSYDNVCNFDSYIKEVITSDLQQRVTDLEKEVLDKNSQIKGYEEQVGGLVKKVDEITGQLKEANTSADGFRKQHNEFVAYLASKLGTRQETVEILASIDTCLEFEDKADKLDRQIELERKEHEYAVSVFEKKIATLESNLEALKADFKALKDTQNTSVKVMPKYSILDIIKKLLGVI